MDNRKRRLALQEMARRERQRRYDTGIWSMSAGDFAKNIGTVASSIVAEPIAGLVGASLAPHYGSDIASQAISNVRNKLTYMPESETARAGMEKLAHNLQPIGDAIQNLSQVPGDAVFEATGSPAAATVAYSALPALAEALGFKGVRGVNTGRKLEMGDISDLTKTPGAKERGIFAGVKAKNADLDKLKAAQKMDEAGADRGLIWKETGWYKGHDNKWRFEISDALDFDTGKGADIQPKSLEMMREYGGTPQPDLLEHPELYDNYPNLKGVRVLSQDDSGANMGLRASYNTSTDNIQLGKDLIDPKSATDLSNTESINLHEIQHAIQNREGFASGGNPDGARDHLRAARSAQLLDTNSSNRTFYEIRDSNKSASLADYVNRLDILSRKESIKPSSITSLSDFYQYSDQIRERLGAMPKKPGAQRDEWLRGAAAYIRNKNYDQLNYNDKHFLEMAVREPKAFLSAKRKLEKEMKKVLPDVQKRKEITKKYDELEKMDDFEIYQRLGGEVEARNVQKRHHMTPEERAATPPWETLDVPEDEIIVNRPSLD